MSKLSSEQIQEILAALIDGEPMLSVGKRFNVDHTTILYHKKRNGIDVTEETRRAYIEARRKRAYESKMKRPYVRRTQKTATILPKVRITNYFEKIIFGERTNKGLSSYKKYLDWFKQKQSQSQ